MREIPHNMDKFESYTLDDMLKYIKDTDTKYLYLYDIFSYKFDEKYNTSDKKIELFNNMSLAALNKFSNTYIPVDNKLDHVLEETWINATNKKYNRIIKHIEDILIKDERVWCWTVTKLQHWKDLQYISNDEYEIARKMNLIFQTISCCNLKYITFKSDEDLNLVLNFTDFINRQTKGIDIPKLLRLEYDKVIRLINNYNKLQQQLIALSDKDIPINLTDEEENELIKKELGY